jgi:hypothetical protein
MRLCTSGKYSSGKLEQLVPGKTNNAGFDDPLRTKTIYRDSIDGLFIMKQEAQKRATRRYAHAKPPSTPSKAMPGTGVEPVRHSPGSEF